MIRGRRKNAVVSRSIHALLLSQILKLAPDSSSVSMLATTPVHGLRYVVPTRSWLLRFRCCSSSLAPLSPSEFSGGNKTQKKVTHDENNINGSNEKTAPYYPKRGQTVELVCESLGFKGKGICKVDGTGFVVMCDRALPGERFLGRITRRKGSYAEV